MLEHIFQAIEANNENLAISLVVQFLLNPQQDKQQLLAMLNTPNEGGDTLLSKATEKGFHALIAALTSANPDHTFSSPDQIEEIEGAPGIEGAGELKDDDTPLYHPNNDDDSAPQYLSREAAAEAKDPKLVPEAPLTPLMQAARDNNLSALPALIKTTDKSEVDRIFRWAAENGKKAVVEKFITEGTQVDIQDAAGKTALMLAANKGQHAVVDYLLTQNANPNATDNQRITVLMYAAGGGDLTVVQAIGLQLKRWYRSVIHQKDHLNRTALMWGIQSKNPEVVRYLLNEGAYQTLKNIRLLGQQLLTRTARVGSQPIVDLLLDLKGKDNKPLLDINKKHYFEGAPLPAAAANGHLALVQYLIEAKEANPNLQGYFSREPWESFRYDGKWDSLSADKKNSHWSSIGYDGKWDSLSAAAKNGHTEIVNYLLSLKTADGKPRVSIHGSNSNYTPLVLAAHNAHLETVEALLSAGASAGACGEPTALVDVLLGPEGPTTTALLECLRGFNKTSASKAEKNRRRQCALRLIATMDATSLGFKFFSEVTSYSEHSALEVALQHNEIDLAIQILYKVEHVGHPDIFQIAFKRKRLDFIELLLKKKAPIYPSERRNLRAYLNEAISLNNQNPTVQAQAKACLASLTSWEQPRAEMQSTSSEYAISCSEAKMDQETGDAFDEGWLEVGDISEIRNSGEGARAAYRKANFPDATAEIQDKIDKLLLEIRKGNENVAIPLIDSVEAFDLSTRTDYQGQTALICAAALGREATISALLAKGVILTAKDDTSTALRRAVQMGHTNCAKILADAGALNSRAGHPYTDLMNAIAKNEKSLALALIALYSDSPLLSADGGEHEAVAPSNINLIVENLNALDIALRQKSPDLEIVCALLNKGAKPQDLKKLRAFLKRNAHKPGVQKHLTSIAAPKMEETDGNSFLNRFQWRRSRNTSPAIAAIGNAALPPTPSAPPLYPVVVDDENKDEGQREGVPGNFNASDLEDALSGEGGKEGVFYQPTLATLKIELEKTQETLQLSQAENEQLRVENSQLQQENTYLATENGLLHRQAAKKDVEIARLQSLLNSRSQVVSEEKFVQPAAPSSPRLSAPTSLSAPTNGSGALFVPPPQLEQTRIKAEGELNEGEGELDHEEQPGRVRVLTKKPPTISSASRTAVIL